MTIYCARCRSRVHVTGSCRTCKKWPGGFDAQGRPLLNEANDRANADRAAKRKSARIRGDA